MFYVSIGARKSINHRVNQHFSFLLLALRCKVTSQVCVFIEVHKIFMKTARLGWEEKRKPKHKSPAKSSPFGGIINGSSSLPRFLIR